MLGTVITTFFKPNLLLAYYIKQEKDTNGTISYDLDYLNYNL